MKESLHILLIGNIPELITSIKKMLIDAEKLRKDISAFNVTHLKTDKDLVQVPEDEIDVVLLGLDLGDARSANIIRNVHKYISDKSIFVLYQGDEPKHLPPFEQDKITHFFPLDGMNGRFLGHVLVCAVRTTDVKLKIKETLQETETRLAELQVVIQASLSLAASLELQSALNSILENAMAFVPADDAHIFLYDGEHLEFGAALFDSEQQQKPYSDPRQNGLTYTVARTGEVIIVNDVMTHPLFTEWQWGGSIAGLPLKIGDEVQGVMNIAFTQQHTFSKDELQILKLLASQAAIIIHNASLYEQAQQEIAERKQIEKALKESEHNYKTLFETMTSAFAVHEIILDENGEPCNYRFLEVNTAFALLVNQAAEDLVGKTILDVLPKASPYWIRRFGHVALSGNMAYFEEYSPGLGKYYAVHAYCPQHGKFATLFTDITALRYVEKALRESEEKYRSLFERVPIGIYRTTAEGKILDANPALVEMLGYPDKETLLRINMLDIFVHPEDREKEQALLAEEKTLQGYEIQVLRSDGSIIWVQDTAQAIEDDNGQLLYYHGSLEDITERKRMEEAIKYMANHDALTGLPNRRLFNERIKLELAHARRDNQKLGLLLLDLDGLKTVNDTLGHNAGDQLLITLSNRLLEVLRESDTIARIGGDEFLVLLPDLDYKKDGAMIAKRILTAICQPFTYNGEIIQSSASIGIAVYPIDGEDIETLIKNADTAMYRVKAQGGKGYELY